MLNKLSVFLVVLMIIAGCSMPTADVNRDNSAGLQVIDGKISQEISKAVKLADLKDAQIITEWKTTASNESITLPLESTGIYDCTVDWGDNSPKVKITYATRTHVYSKTGTHIVVINGKFSGWSFNNQGDRLKIYQLYSWNNMNFGNNGGYFYGCKNLTIQTWDTPDFIGTTNMVNAFRDCSSIVMVPNIQLWNIRSIGDSTFSNCSKLASIIIPPSVTSIGYDAFYDCHGLTSINIPTSVTSIGDYAFDGCTGLTSITIPNSVTSIGDGAFYCCRNLMRLTIPNNVTCIGDCAFYGCYGLTSLTIPNSITYIGDWSFVGCHGLTSITIPNSVTSIGDWAFIDCTRLTSVTIQAKTPIPLGTSVFFGVSPDLIIKVPSGSLDAYKNALNWWEYASKMVGY